MMYNTAYTEKKIIKIFHDTLHFVPPDIHADLFSIGGLDSLMFVDLLDQLEQVFEVKIPLEDLELDNFNSISSIVQTLNLIQQSDKRENDSSALTGKQISTV